MKSAILRRGLRPALAALAFVFLALPATAADYKAEDYAALLKALPSAKHNLVEVIGEVTKGGEVAIEAKFELDKTDLMVGAYTSEKGLAADAKAANDRPGTVFEIKALVENGAAIFSVLVAHDGTMSRVTYDLVTGSRKT